MSEEMVIDLHNTQLLKALPQVNYYGQRPWRKNLTGNICNKTYNVLVEAVSNRCFHSKSWLLVSGAR